MTTAGLASWACSAALCSARAGCFSLVPRYYTSLLMLLAAGVFWMTAVPAQAQTTPLCTLAWDANTQPTLAGYKLYHSKTSGVFGAPAEVIGLQTQTTCEQMGLTAGDNMTHYFVVTAYTSAGLESIQSNQVSQYFPAPAPPPTCVRFLPNGRCKK